MAYSCVLCLNPAYSCTLCGRTPLAAATSQPHACMENPCCSSCKLRAALDLGSPDSNRELTVGGQARQYSRDDMKVQ